MTKTKMKTAAEREKGGKIGDVENSESDVLPPPPHRSMMDRKCDGIRAISPKIREAWMISCWVAGR